MATFTDTIFENTQTLYNHSIENGYEDAKNTLSNISAPYTIFRDLLWDGGAIYRKSDNKYYADFTMHEKAKYFEQLKALVYICSKRKLEGY